LILLSYQSRREPKKAQIRGDFLKFPVKFPASRELRPGAVPVAMFGIGLPHIAAGAVRPGAVKLG
jgi:hypothetical protein